MKRMHWLTALAAVLVVALLTVAIHATVRRAHEIWRNRLIILAYQTNINGSDGEAWAQYLESAYPDQPGFEVSVYSLREAGNDTITITSEDGWQQIVTRLAAGQGDILFLNNKIFYETMLAGGYLLPLQGDFINAVTDAYGTVYGLDITGMTVDGLLNLNTSTVVGKGQKLPILCADEKPYTQGETDREPRVIAVVYKGSRHAENAKALLTSWFGVNGHA